MSPLSRLLGYLLPYRRQFALGLLCVVLTQGVALTGPWVLQLAIDDLGSGMTRSKLARYGGVLIGIGIVRG